MNGLTPNCLDDFLFSNPSDKRTLELILAQTAIPIYWQDGHSAARHLGHWQNHAGGTTARVA